MQPINNPLYREINNITFIAPSAEDRQQRYHFGAMLGILAGAMIAFLVFA